MAFSEFLDGKRGEIKQLIAELSPYFSYVSVLATDVKASQVMANRMNSAINEGAASECGFVVKMNDGRSFFEYSTDDIGGDKKALAQEILQSLEINPDLHKDMITANPIADDPLVQSFERPCDFDDYSPEQLIDYCKNIKDKLLATDAARRRVGAGLPRGSKNVENLSKTQC